MSTNAKPKSLAKGGIVVLGGRLGAALLAFAAAILAAKLTENATYTTYSQTIAIVSLAVTGCFTWNRQAYCRNYYLAKESQTITELDRFALMSMMGSMVVAAVVATIAYLALVGNSIAMVGLVVLLVPARALFEFQIERERVRENFVGAAIRSLARPTVFLSLVVAAYYLFRTGDSKISVVGLLVPMTIGYAVASLSSTASMIGTTVSGRGDRSGNRSETTVDHGFHAWPMLRIWIPVSVGLMVDVITHNSAKFYTDALLGPDPAGDYSKLADITRQGFGTLGLVLAAMQIQGLQRREAAGTLTREHLNSYLRRNTLVVIGATALAAIATPPFFWFLFPGNAASAGSVFIAWISVASVISATKIYLLDGVLILLGKQRAILFVSIGSVLLSQVLCYILINRYELFGAAIAMLGTYAFGAFVSLGLAKRWISNFPSDPEHSPDNSSSKTQSEKAA